MKRILCLVLVAVLGLIAIPTLAEVSSVDKVKDDIISLDKSSHLFTEMQPFSDGGIASDTINVSNGVALVCYMDKQMAEVLVFSSDNPQEGYKCSLINVNEENLQMATELLSLSAVMSFTDINVFSFIAIENSSDKQPQKIFVMEKLDDGSDVLPEIKEYITSVFIGNETSENSGSSLDISEGFSIHSGVKFGMTRDEVIAAEKEGGFTAKTGNRYDVYCIDNNHSGESVVVSGTIAGEDNAMISYHFDKNGKLSGALYSFSGDVPRVKDALVEKYGNISSEWTDIAKTKFEPDAYGFHFKALDLIETLPQMFSTDLRDEASWVVDIGDGNSVIITYVSCINDRVYHISNVSYQIVSTEEIMQYYTEQNNQLADDL